MSNFSISIHGQAIETLEDLKESLAKYVLHPENVDTYADQMWAAKQGGFYEDLLDSYVDIEPVVASIVEYFPVTQSQAVQPLSVQASSQGRSVSEVITKAAAAALLRDGLSDHFYYTDEGTLMVSPVCPPTLEKSYEMIKRTLEVRETSSKLENYSSWLLGMLGDQLENLFGNDFDVTNVMKASGKSYATYITAVNTYRALWNERRPNLNYTSHKEVYYSKISPEDKVWILDKGNELSMKTAEVRKLLSYARNYGVESLRQEDPRDLQSLMALTEVKSVNKNFTFYIPVEDKWYQFRGPFHLIPNGASPIIDTDTKEYMNPDGSKRKLETWQAVGFEAPYIRGHAARARNNQTAEEVIVDDSPTVEMIPEEDNSYEEAETSDF